MCAAAPIPKLDTVPKIVTFHGHLATDQPANTRDLRAPVLVLHASEDPAIPDEMVTDFITEMREAKADWQMVHFGGQVHAFTDSNAAIPRKASYHQRTDYRYWRMMSNFLTEAFGTDQLSPRPRQHSAIGHHPAPSLFTDPTMILASTRAIPLEYCVPSIYAGWHDRCKFYYRQPAMDYMVKCSAMESAQNYYA